jgi:hypothetical protein
MDLRVAAELIIPERELGWRFPTSLAPAGNPLFRRFGRWERHQLSPGIRCPNADNSASVTLSRPLRAHPLSGSNARQKRCLESFDRLCLRPRVLTKEAVIPRCVGRPGDSQSHGTLRLLAFAHFSWVERPPHKGSFLRHRSSNTWILDRKASSHQRRFFHAALGGA